MPIVGVLVFTTRCFTFDGIRLMCVRLDPLIARDHVMALLALVAVGWVHFYSFQTLRVTLLQLDVMRRFSTSVIPLPLVLHWGFRPG